MPRTDEQNQQIKDRRRAKIIRAAIRVFATKGYNEVSVDDITKDARCSHGLFYHYFDNKAEILAAIVDEIIVPSSYYAPCHKALEAKGVAGLKVLLSFFNGVWAAGPSVFNTAWLACQTSQIEDVPETIVPFVKENNLYETVCVLVEQGQKEKKIVPGDPKEIALGLTDIIANNFLRLVNDGKKSPVVSSDVILGMALVGERID